MSSTQAPPAWYPDPAGGSGNRWWDGAAWTEHVRAWDPPAPPAPPLKSYVPMASLPVEVREQHDAVRVYTPQVWWLAFSPAWLLLVQVIVIVATADRTVLDTIAVIVGIFVTAGLTMADRKLLLQSGHRDAASTWWWLLTPLAYLVARGAHLQRTAGRGWIPCLVYAALITILAVTSIATGGLNRL